MYADQPRVRRNEWQALAPPALGAPATWTPTLSVSVVVPAYDAGLLLPHVLAGLAAQTYPAHLLEVVVANDGPGPLALPEVRPERTRIVEVEQGWGRANACHTGALAADGEVLHWYDADMLAERHEVEAQLRWHHEIDHAVTLGDKWFVDPAPVLALTPQQTRAAVAADAVAELFAGLPREPHQWIEDIYGRTDRLRRAGWNALRTHAGATAAVRRDLYLESGGMHTELRLGEDIALGARLGAVGAVFVPDAEARSWHLGHTHVMARRDQVNAYNDPFLAQRAPVLHAKRHPGRSYRRPYAEVVLDVADHPADAVVATVEAVLASTLHDLVVRLTGAWPAPDDDRRPVLDDDRTRWTIIGETFAGDPRVHLGDETTDADKHDAAAFRVTLPGAAYAPGPRALEGLLLHLEHTHDGLRLVELPDGTRVRVERTAALARAARTRRPDEPLDDVLAEVAGAATVDAERAGFGPSADVRPRHYPRYGGPPVDDTEAWRRVSKALGAR